MFYWKYSLYYNFSFNGNALILRGLFRTLSNMIEVFANTYIGKNNLYFITDNFPTSVFAKCSILNVWLNVQLVWNMPMNTAGKHLLNNYWWALKSIEIKRCIGMKWMPSLNICAFISPCNGSFFCLVFQALKHVSIQPIIHFLFTGIINNKCWLCLFSK